MESNGWDQYKIYILDELKELKEAAKRQDADHLKVRDAIAELRADIKGFKTSQKWELRILSAFWGLLIMAINAIIGKHG